MTTKNPKVSLYEAIAVQSTTLIDEVIGATGGIQPGLEPCYMAPAIVTHICKKYEFAASFGPFVKYAARNGHIAMLFSLRENGAPWSFSVYETLLKNNGFETTRDYCESFDCPWSNNAKMTHITVVIGSIEMLQYLKKRGVKFSQENCTQAILANQKGALQYLYDIGFARSDKDCLVVLENNRVEFLDLFKGEISFFSAPERLVLSAIKNNHVEITEHILSRSVYNNDKVFMYALDVGASKEMLYMLYKRRPRR